ncbi:MAG: hypothetical protein M1834_000230 [Cirrosporium novae-zelandiae]|nr:MAG: hypothetical protein M1834_000230 [Cirrosporium novae-zelandiae]
MQLTFKDLSQQKFLIEADPSETIAEVKEKIQKEKGWDATLQKLIYSGKVLKDAQTIGSYNIEEKGFVVCMVGKPKAGLPNTSKASSSKAPSTPAPAAAQTPAAPPAPAPVSAPAPAPAAAASNPPATPSPAPASTTQGSRDFNDPSTLSMGAQREQDIAEMESMGFPRAEIDRAMRAAFNNPTRAVEYLLSGIPDHLAREQQQPQSPSARPATSSAPTAGTATTNPSGESGEPGVNLFEAAAQAGQRGNTGRSPRPSGGSTARGSTGSAAPSETTAGGLGNLDFLRNNPQFQQLRQVVQQQPQMLEPILQQVGQGNPSLARLIGEYPDQFLQLLSEDGDEDAALPPGAQAISVTEEEREAIERLCRLGFERDLVIQAYFACDKNEELAANFLFEQPPDEDQES